jgi:hypothetical protein
MRVGLSLAELLVDPTSTAPAIVATLPLPVLSYKALAERIERLAGQLSNPGLQANRQIRNDLGERDLFDPHHCTWERAR